MSQFPIPEQHTPSIYSFSSRPTTAPSSPRDTFTSPPTRFLAATTATNEKPLLHGGGGKRRLRMPSTMLASPSSIPKPWLDGRRDPYVRIAHVATYAMASLGLLASILVCFFGYRSVPMVNPHRLCMVLDERWDAPEEVLFGENGRWLREVRADGFGNGEFEVATASSNNSFIKHNKLYILPTLTSDVLGTPAIFDRHTLNLTDCTYNLTKEAYPSTLEVVDDTQEGAYWRACSAVSNATAGTVIPPVMSARLSTRRSVGIRYGKVEVRAKLPTGDWLWPAIWMLPVVNTYGPWPISGEIDIMEARGNGPRGSNVVRGSLNWGPLNWINRVALTYGWWMMRRGTYADGFHTYTLEWTDEFLRIYVDTRLHHMLDVRFDVPFFKRGKFPDVVPNRGGDDEVVLKNPWVNGSLSAPFDQKFYLVLNVAVGGTNGWFPDGKGGKPWLDGAMSPMRDFAQSQGEWYKTWPESEDERAMIVESVKMWELC